LVAIAARRTARPMSRDRTLTVAAPSTDAHLVDISAIFGRRRLRDPPAMTGEPPGSDDVIALRYRLTRLDAGGAAPTSHSRAIGKVALIGMIQLAPLAAALQRDARPRAARGGLAALPALAAALAVGELVRARPAG